MSLSLSELCQFSSLSCFILCIGFFYCIVCFLSLVLLQHTALKWFSLAQSLHIFPYVGQFLGLCAIPWYLQHLVFLFCGVLVCSAMYWSGSFLYFALITISNSLHLSCYLTWLSGIIELLLTLLMMILVHLWLHSCSLLQSIL